MGVDKMLFTVLLLFLRAARKWNIFLAQIRLSQVICWLLLKTEYRGLSTFSRSCKSQYLCSLKDTLATVWIGCCIKKQNEHSHGTRVHEILLVHVKECNINKFSQPSFSCSYNFLKRVTHFCAESCLIFIHEQRLSCSSMCHIWTEQSRGAQTASLVLQQQCGQWPKKERGRSKNNFMLYFANISQVTHVIEMDRDYASGGNYSLQERKQEHGKYFASLDFPETLIWDIKLLLCTSLSWDWTSPLEDEKELLAKSALISINKNFGRQTVWQTLPNFFSGTNLTGQLV